MTATLLMQKNQNEKRMTKMPDIVPMTRTMSPSGMAFWVKTSV
jgi:hypothetical protein